MAEQMSPDPPDPPQEEKKHKYYITAAIDFGTTFSCYAFSFNDGTRKGEIIYNENWGGELNTESLKTPTCVLTGPNHEFHSFGYKALEFYQSLSKSDKIDYNMYSNYKKELHTTQSYYGPARIKSNTGYDRDAIDIFVMGVMYLKDHMMSAIKGEAPHVTNDDIQWVLCAPAIWSAPAKEFIRKVAKKVGMITDDLPSQLLLALEPEAAAIFCRSVEMNHFTKGPEQLDMKHNENPSFRFTTDTKFVLIDAGGGTVDITSYQLKDKGKLEELYQPSGGAWGGTEVDNNFFKLLEQVFGEKFFTQFQKDFPGPSLSMLIDFQKAKLSLKTKDQNAIKIPMNFTLGTEFARVTGKRVDEAVQASNTGVQFDGEKLVIPFALAKKRLFDPPVKEIIKHVTKMLQDSRLQKLDYIMLVGGFGQCDILQKAVFDSFNAKATVLLPLEAQVAVIRGAVRFGQDPNQVSVRVAALTYGENIYENFDQAKHDKSHCEEIEGQLKARDCFRIFVKKGESVKMNEIREFIGNPLYSGQKSACRKFFSSDKISPKYIDEDGVNLVGEVTLSMPDTALGKDRKVLSKVKFGGTEITVDVTETTRDGSEIVTAKMDFLAS